MFNPSTFFVIDEENCQCIHKLIMHNYVHFFEKLWILNQLCTLRKVCTLNVQSLKKVCTLNLHCCEHSLQELCTLLEKLCMLNIQHCEHSLKNHVY